MLITECWFQIWSQLKHWEMTVNTLWPWHIVIWWIWHGGVSRGDLLVFKDNLTYKQMGCVGQWHTLNLNGSAIVICFISDRQRFWFIFNRSPYCFIPQRSWIGCMCVGICLWWWTIECEWAPLPSSHDLSQYEVVVNEILGINFTIFFY